MRTLSELSASSRRPESGRLSARQDENLD